MTTSSASDDARPPTDDAVPPANDAGPPSEGPPSAGPPSEGLGTLTEGPVEFLSDDWLAAADAALALVPPLPGPVVVGYVTRGGPMGERRHRLVLGPDRVGAVRGTEGAVAVMTMSWDLAVALSQGRASAQQAFLDGEIELTGDPVALLGQTDQLAAIDDVLAPLRARTTYPSSPA